MNGPSADLVNSTPADGAASEESELTQPAPSLERLVADAMSLAVVSPTEGPISGPDLADLVNRYWRLVPDDDLVGHTAAEMLGDVRSHLALAEQRLPGQLKIHAEPSADGCRTVLQIVTDDMPFIVDSVTAALTARQLDLDLPVHPQVVLHRQP